MDDSPLLAPGVHRLTVNLDDDDVDLFEGLWPVPHGVALHAYLVQGHRAVVIDPWDAGGYGAEEVGADLDTLGLGWAGVAAVAFTKPPRPEAITNLLAARPGLEVWGVPATGARHDLGGASLVESGGFWRAEPAGVVFTGDAFAGLGWVDDELFAEDLAEPARRHFEDEALRWFAGRPAPVPALPPGAVLLAPAHGLARRDPAGARDLALRFEAWGQGDALDEVAVVWPAAAATDEVNALVGGVLDVGAGVSLLRVPGDGPTALAAAARRASLVVVGAGVDEGFLKGLRKDVWRPEAGLSPDALRRGVADQWSGA